MATGTVTWLRNPVSGKLEDTYDPAKVGYIAEYLFSGASTYAQVKNGFSWEFGTRTIATPAGETEAGGVFSVTGTADPRIQPVPEQKYFFNQISEFWLKKRFFIPSNYLHRRVSILTITGDISAWQFGDSLLANNGIETATIEYIDGQTIYMLFPTNSTVGANQGPWHGSVTNVTRGVNLPCAYGGIWGDNNKFHALWCDGYSQSGQSPSVVFEMRERGNGGSSLYYHYAIDGGVTGVSPGSTSPQVDFIRPSDFGKWFDWIVHIKMASSESATDGIIEDWVRREGESDYTLLHRQTNAKIGPRAAASPPFCQFKAGYCHGAMNTNFRVNTSIYDSEIILSNQVIDGVG